MKNIINIKYILGLACAMTFAIGVNGSSLEAGTEKAYQHISEALVEKASSAIAQENLDEAITLFRQAMVANPKNINSYIGLAALYTGKGQYGLGLKYYDIALSINPVNVIALEGSINTNLKRHDLDSATITFTTMKDVCKIVSCDRLDDIKNAIEDFEKDLSEN